MPSLWLQSVELGTRGTKEIMQPCLIHLHAISLVAHAISLWLRCLVHLHHRTSLASSPPWKSLTFRPYRNRVREVQLSSQVVKAICELRRTQQDTYVPIVADELDLSKGQLCERQCGSQMKAVVALQAVWEVAKPRPLRGVRSRRGRGKVVEGQGKAVSSHHRCPARDKKLPSQPQRHRTECHRT